MTYISAHLSEAPAGPTGPTPGIQPAPAKPAGPVTPGQPAAPTTFRQVTVELPEITAGKVQMSVDDATGRVVGKVIDRDTGDLLWQVPSDDMLRLIAATEELLGPLYSTEA